MAAFRTFNKVITSYFPILPGAGTKILFSYYTFVFVLELTSVLELNMIVDVEHEPTILSLKLKIGAI